MNNLHIEAMPGVGAEITGIDLTNISDELFENVKAAFAQHGLVFFRDQHLSEQDHIRLAERFGVVNINRFFKPHPGYPQIALVSKEPNDTDNIGGGWHTDHSYDEEPALGSILVARELPSEGGDTWFTSMYGAYDALSPGLQRTLESLNAVHSAKQIFGTAGGYSRGVKNTKGRIGNSAAADSLMDPVHPVVIQHPLSGQKCLYVNPTFTRYFEGWSREESLPLLEYLYNVATRDDNVYHFKWRPGSIAFWDNRATWHFAQNDYQGHRRVMHRITVEGCALAAAA